MTDAIENDEEGENPVEKPASLKILDYILCRGDMAREKLETNPVPLNDLFRYANSTDRSLLSIGIVCSLLNGLNTPIISILGGQLANVYLGVPFASEEFVERIAFLVIIAFIMFPISFFFSWIQFACFRRVAYKVTSRIRQEYIKSLLRQEAGWFDERSCGLLTTQLNDNIDRIRDGIGERMARLISVLTMSIACLVLTFYADWRIGLTALPLIPVALFCMNVLDRKMAVTTTKEMVEVGKAGAVAEEAVLGVKTVQALNGQEEMVSRYNKVLAQGAKYATARGRWNGLMTGIFGGMLYVFAAIALILGGYLLSQKIVTDVGLILAGITAMMASAYELGILSPQLTVILNARVAAAVIYKVINRKPRIDSSSEKGKELTKVSGEVEFKNIRFSYPTRKEAIVLDNFSLKIDAGHTVALVGHSGCGKSTAVGLLTRLYEAQSGEVLIDGMDVSQLKLSNLREIVGIVQQEPKLFSASIKENITLGREGISQKQIEEVARMANAHEFIKKLSKGYDTVIGDGGIQLSGGQKQRIAIARTLIRNPKILLLDEATSALDGHSEKLVQEALDRASKGRTTIMIAHRLSTVVNADVIVMMEKGKIVEMGKHSELVANDGKYAALVKSQAMEKTDEHQHDDHHPQHLEESGAHAFVNAAFSDTSSIISVHSLPVDVCSVDTVEETKKKIKPDDVGLGGVFREAIIHHKLLLLGAVIAAMGYGIEGPLAGVIWGKVMTGLKEVETNSSALFFSCLFFIVIGVIFFVSSIAGYMLFTHLGETLILDLRSRTFRNILHQDAAYFDEQENSPGKMITRLATDAPNLKAVLDSRMMHVLAYLMAWIACAGLALIGCWPLGILTVVISVVYAVAIDLLTRVVHRRSLHMQTHNQAGKIAVEIIENVRTIQLLSGEQVFSKHYKKASNNLTSSEIVNGYLEAANYAVTQSFIFVACGCANGLGAYILHQETYSLEIVYMAITNALLSCSCLFLGTTFHPEIVRGRTAAALMFRIMRRQPATGDIYQGERKELTGDVEFQNVKFTYPQRPDHPAMRGLSFTANRGMTVALVGPSGSGKSTTISLMERFYEVADGAVLFDGADLRTYSLYHLRSQMALVEQEPRLFAGTIKDNICFGLDSIDDQKVQNALRMANAEKFVSSLPQGLDTEVGEKGTQLSGGQKQRIAIARVLVREPRVLLLDEATSALDGQSERAVQEALDEARKGRTCITVSHRLSSIRNADMIIFIEDGRIREQGTHSQLMQLRGKYYDMVQKQTLETSSVGGEE